MAKSNGEGARKGERLGVLGNAAEPGGHPPDRSFRRTGCPRRPADPCQRRLRPAIAADANLGTSIMRCLVVFCHPSEGSFAAAILETACAALRDSGHDLRVIDLYRDRFNPVLSAQEWNTYLSDTRQNIAALERHVQSMQWAESLILIFPTWMYGPPAMLKGWLERVWLPGVAFEIPRGSHRRATGLFTNIRHFTVVTTSGSPWWWLRVIRDPCRSLFTRGLRILFHRRCRVRWLQLHAMDHSNLRQRQAFLNRVRTELTALG